MYIHLMEMSQHPERALEAADRLRGLVPDAGHLLHMPTHIDVLCGRYAEVVESNSRAKNADSMSCPTFAITARILMVGSDSSDSVKPQEALVPRRS